MVANMPGMDFAAPERTETRSGARSPPRRRPVASSNRAIPSRSPWSSAVRACGSFRLTGAQSSVGNTNAGGTFKPSRFICQISAAFDPASSGVSSSDWPAVPI